MPKQPIRSLIERALEKSDRISDFTALPVLYETGEQKTTAGPQHHTIWPVLHDLGDEKVVAVWYTPEAVELALSNEMRISIQISPPTLAMRIIPASQAGDESVALLTLIRHDEDFRSSAQIVESRIHALRQLYAIGVISQEPERYVSQLKGIAAIGDFDFENLLEWDEKLIIRSAGEGTFWTVIEKATIFAKKAPKTALVFLTTMLKGGVARTERYVDAYVQSAQAAADKATAEAKALEIQNEVVQEKAKETSAQSQLETERLQAAVNKEKVDLRRAEFAAEKEKLDAFREYVDWLDNIKDPELKEKMRLELMRSSRELIGPITDRWLELPPPRS